MSQEWMIDVLSDLRKFALANGLMGLAEQLDHSILVAAAELNLDGRPHGLGIAKLKGCTRPVRSTGDNC